MENDSRLDLKEKKAQRIIIRDIKSYTSDA